MVRPESREAYHSLNEKAKKRTLVLNAIAAIQPCSDKEIANYLKWEINRVTPRRGELVEMGKIREHGKKIQNSRTVNV